MFGVQRIGCNSVSGRPAQSVGQQVGFLEQLTELQRIYRLPTRGQLIDRGGVTPAVAVNVPQLQLGAPGRGRFEPAVRCTK